MNDNILTEEQLNEIDADVDQEIEAAIKFAKDAPFPVPDGLEDEVYA